MPKVYNKRMDRDIPREAVYIGRPSKWGNPFKIGTDGTREEVIEKYRRYTLAHMARNSAFWDRIKGELGGKDLVCWCSPLPCHGDILLEIANE